MTGRAGTRITSKLGLIESATPIEVSLITIKSSIEDNIIAAVKCNNNR